MSGDDLPRLDTRHAHPGRVYNYWLGGHRGHRVGRGADPGLRRAGGADGGDDEQWRPEPGTLSPPLVTAWCGVARKR